MAQTPQKDLEIDEEDIVEISDLERQSETETEKEFRKMANQEERPMRDGAQMCDLEQMKNDESNMRSNSWKTNDIKELENVSSMADEYQEYAGGLDR